MALNTDMIRLLQGSTIGEAISPIRVDAVKPAILQLTPGANVSAQVLGQLSNGQSIVRIAGELLAMELPAGSQVGDTLPMTFMGSEPRPTFTLSRQTVSGAPVSLSQLGRLLGQITQGAEAETPAQVNQLPRLDRLSESPPLDTAALAVRLREALSKSGIFYESHVAQWTEGKRPLAELLQEPQGTLSRPELLNRLATPPAPTLPQEEGAAALAPTPDEPEAPQTTASPAPQRGPNSANSTTEPDLSQIAPRQAAPAPPSPPTSATPPGQGPEETAHSPAAPPATAQQTVPAAPSPGQASASSQAVTAETRPPATPGQPLPQVSQLPPDPNALRLREVYQRLAPEPPSQSPPATMWQGAVDQQTAPGAEAQLPDQVRSLPHPPGLPAQTLTETTRQPHGASPQEVSPAADQPHSTAGEGAAQSAPPSPRHDLADPQTFPLIRQQLATLNSGQLVWQGEAWPGQQLKWEVEERDARDNEREQEGAWKTSLRLELPNLGEVRANLRISGRQVRLQLQAADPATVTIMETQTSRLADALSGAGLDLIKLAINHGKTEPA